jgi:hypothetical protein
LAIKTKRPVTYAQDYLGKNFPQIRHISRKKGFKLPFLDYRFLQLLVNSGDSINFLLFSLASSQNLACGDSQVHLSHEIEKKNHAPYPLQLDDQSTRIFSQNWLLT